MKTLVAGGSGLVGSNLTRRLVALGDDVTATYFTRPCAILDAHYEPRDFRDFQDYLGAVAAQDRIFICAAQSSSATEVASNPTGFMAGNVAIVGNLLEACAVHGVKNVVLMSSATVYQEAFRPLQEDELDLNLPPAGNAAAGYYHRYVEALASKYREAHGMKISVVRPVNIYGPHDAFHLKNTRLVPALLKRAMAKETPFKVQGDGNEVRGFIYVEDVVSDLLWLSENNRNLTVNLSSGNDLTVRQALGLILMYAQHDATPEFDANSTASVPYRTVSGGKLKTLTGDRPRIGFGEGIRKTIEWLETQK